MTKVTDNYWRINPSVALENTGHNIIKLNVPDGATTVSACFEGLNRQEGYRVKNVNYAEWRYGFVAQLNDGSRVYGDMGKSVYLTPKDTIYFNCPADCKRLYFVVSGGPKRYWRQVWDDNDNQGLYWYLEKVYKITGTGKFVSKGDKNSWGNEDRDVIYLEYEATIKDLVKCTTYDTLVVRNRGVVMETFTPELQP